MRDFRAAQGFIIDMDGTFFLGDSLLPGALELLQILNQKKLPFSFLTNNTSRSKEDYQKKLVGLGVKKEDAYIFTASDATISFLKHQYAEKRVFLMGTRSLRNSFRLAGIQLVNRDPQVLVLAYDTELTYDRLAKFCTYVQSGLPYIATHGDINCPTPDGFVPDIGAIMALIEASTGRKADFVIGKPNPLIVAALAQSWGLATEELVMVGDRLYTDIALGKTAGVMTVLVLSGETGWGDLIESEYQPDFIVENLNELSELLK